MLEAEQPLGILEQPVVPARELPVGGEDVRGVDVALVKRLVLSPNLDRLELGIGEPVDALQAREALDAIRELRPRPQRETGQPAQVREAGQPLLLREDLSSGDRVDVLERRLLAERLAALGVVVSG